MDTAEMTILRSYLPCTDQRPRLFETPMVYLRHQERGCLDPYLRGMRDVLST